LLQTYPAKRAQCQNAASSQTFGSENVLRVDISTLIKLYIMSWKISFPLHHYTPLPQPIVCGDQSSGKSSVLEIYQAYSSHPRTICAHAVRPKESSQIIYYIIEPLFFSLTTAIASLCHRSWTVVIARLLLPQSTVSSSERIALVSLPSLASIAMRSGDCSRKIRSSQKATKD